MTDEDKRGAADLAAEIMSADRPSTPGTEGASSRTRGDFVIRAAVAIALAAFILVPVVAIFITRPE